MWSQFLRKTVEAEDGSRVAIHHWTHCLVREGIGPLLRRKQYTPLCSPRELTECLLNYLYKHEKDYRGCRFTTYRCKHLQEAVPEEQEFYEEQITDADWAALRTEFAVDWLADKGSFADRIWRNIPLIVLSHLSMDSPANQKLYEAMATHDSDDNSSTDETN